MLKSVLSEIYDVHTNSEMLCGSSVITEPYRPDDIVYILHTHKMSNTKSIYTKVYSNIELDCLQQEVLIFKADFYYDVLDNNLKITAGYVIDGEEDQKIKIELDVSVEDKNYTRTDFITMMSEKITKKALEDFGLLKYKAVSYSSNNKLDYTNGLVKSIIIADIKNLLLEDYYCNIKRNPDKKVNNSKPSKKTAYKLKPIKKIESLPKPAHSAYSKQTEDRITLIFPEDLEENCPINIIIDKDKFNIGNITGRYVGDIFYLGAFEIQSELRNKCYGEMAFNKLIDYIKSLGIKTIKGEFDKRTRNFYEKFDAKFEDREEDDYEYNIFYIDLD